MKKKYEYRSVSIKKTTYLKIKKIAAKNELSISRAIQYLIERNGKDDLW